MKTEGDSTLFEGADWTQGRIQCVETCERNSRSRKGNPCVRKIFELMFSTWKGRVHVESAMFLPGFGKYIPVRMVYWYTGKIYWYTAARVQLIILTAAHAW